MNNIHDFNFDNQFPYPGMEWLNYNDQRVLYIDYRMKSRDEMIDLLEHTAKFIQEYDGEILLLSDITDATVDSYCLEKTKIYGSQILKQHLKKSAALGVSGIKKFFANLYIKYSGSEIRFFDNKTSALKFLTS